MISGMIIIVLALYAGYMTSICRKQRTIIQAHEANWNRIETLSDHNQNGDVIIHVRATPPIEETCGVEFGIAELPCPLPKKHDGKHSHFKQNKEESK